MTGIMIRILFISFALCTAMFLPGSDSHAQSTPGGSYKDSCRQISVVGGNLVAQCQRADGNWHNSTLNYHDCSGDIWNDNGNLKCKHSSLNPSGRVPSGSYKNSCRDIRTDGNKLKAQCQKRNGVWNNTNINYKNCSGDIWNDNGDLACKGSGSGGNAPRGSYKNSCTDYYTEGNRLYASCKKKNGGWRNTSINYRNCNKDIWNDNGELACGGGGGGSGSLPKGSYKDSCKNIYVEGNVLEADCLNRNGKYSHTSIKYKNCNKGVYNDRGQLRCN